MSDSELAATPGYPDRPDLPPFCTPGLPAPDSRRERAVMSYLAGIVGDDGGPTLDTLPGWLHRVATVVHDLRQDNKQISEQFDAPDAS